MKKVFYILLCVLWGTIAVAQEIGSCEGYLEEVLDTVDASCTGLSRNQACYGNPLIDAIGWDGNIAFNSTGDIENLADIETLSLAPYDGTVWGISVMLLQGNLPETLPGQNITVLVFGDVTLRNAVAPATVHVTTTANARARLVPYVDNNPGNIVTAVPAGVQLNALGRNEAGDWIYVALGQYADNGRSEAWISTLVLQVSGDRMSLPLVTEDFTPPTNTPMRAFYLSTGITQSDCNELPPDGILVQTPEGVLNATFTVNGVDITLGSTAFLRTAEDNLEVYMVEGRGIVA
ncbi:MAG: hypothetical protein D6712_10240, partial [Chloroflexi bacterium]